MSKSAIRRMLANRLIRSFGAGLILAGLYLAVAGGSFRAGLLPLAPVLDGLGPPPAYRWVTPPPARSGNNVAPSAGSGTLALSASGASGSLTTPDGQAQILLQSTSVVPVAGQSAVKVTFQPIDANTVGPPPSGGYVYDSNAYKIAAFYEPSNQPIVTISAVVILTYATNSDRIIQFNGSSWTSLDSTSGGYNNLFASVTSLGIFATAVLSTAAVPTTAKQAGSLQLVLEVAAPFAIIVVVLVVILGRRRFRGPGPPGNPGRGSGPPGPSGGPGSRGPAGPPGRGSGGGAWR